MPSLNVASIAGMVRARLIQLTFDVRLDLARNSIAPIVAAREKGCVNCVRAKPMKSVTRTMAN
jgi:hypothetical protein